MGDALSKEVVERGSYFFNVDRKTTFFYLKKAGANNAEASSLKQPDAGESEHLVYKPKYFRQTKRNH